MNSSTQPRSLVLHISGKETPGIIGRLGELVHTHEARLLHLTQASLKECLVIGAVVETWHEATLQAALEQLAQQAGLHLDVLTAEKGGAPDLMCGLCVTLLGDLSRGDQLSAVTRKLAECALTLQEVRSLRGLAHADAGGLSGVEMIASKAGRIAPAELQAIRAQVLALGPELGIDLAVQRDDFYRRSKRLLCMDVDSTFVKGEFIDELAALVGVKDQVAEITSRAMKGELDFSQALRERVALLEGLPMSRAQELCERFELTPGADDLVRTVKQLGLRVGLVSGGFDFFVEILKERFGLDFAFANELEVEDGKLTGRVTGTIVDSYRKAQLLKDMAHVFGVRHEQTIAVGDGANDIQMLQTAGLGIAYQAKPRLQEVADTRFNHNDRLDSLLYLMGFDAREVVGACR